MVRAFAATLGLLALAACQTTADSSASSPNRVERPAHGNALAFAQAACGGCHAVEHDALSPNPMAAEWPTIVNRPGLTRDTLQDWLLNAHNYPEEMDFDLNAVQAAELSTYMMGLKRSGYEPPIS